MDRLLYISMTGAKETLRAQAVNNHNLANASTTGFRADCRAFQSRAVAGSGYASRVYATNATTGWNNQSGALLSTGRDLDVAIKATAGSPCRAPMVARPTRAPAICSVDPNGHAARPARAIRCSATAVRSPCRRTPPSAVARDGTISIVPLGQGPDTTATVGRIKLVNPPAESLARGDDGLFRMKDGTDAPPDASVQLGSGVLESSNVNTADAMVNMIELARHFEMQVKAMRTAEENGAAAAQIMRLG